MNKSFLCLVSFILLISLHSSVINSYAAIVAPPTTSTDIIITNHNGLSKTIRKGNEFDLTFTLENRSGTKLKDIYVEIEDNGSFYLVNQGSIISLDISSEGVEKDKSINLPRYLKFKYLGGSSNKLTIKIMYKKLINDEWSDELSTIDYIGINAVADDNISKPDPVDTSKDIPVINVSDSSNSTLEAGKNKKITFTLINNSEYTAENISIKPHTLDSDSPISIENTNDSQFISRIRANKESRFHLNIQADITAKEKSYPIKLNYQFYNSHGDLFNSEETIYIKVINQGKSPKLHIDKLDLQPQEVQANGNINVGFFIKNIGTLDARDINLSLEGLDTQTFSLVNMTNQKYQTSLAGNKFMYVTYTLKASNKIESGMHRLDLKLKYKDNGDTNYEDSHQFFINAKAKETKASNLSVENIQIPNNDVSVGDDFKIKFNLKNNGEGKAYNVKVSLDMDKEIIPKSPSIKKFQTMESKEVQSLEFTLSSTSEATTKNYPISINIEYEDDTNNRSEKHTLNQYVGVYVEKDSQTTDSVPKIIIDQYSFNPNIVRAGEDFELNVSFLNTNKSKSIQNIKIFLTVNEETEKSGSAFTPVNSSNTFYIDNIAPKNRVEKNIRMYTVPDAKPKTYTITANFEYEDSNGKEYTSTELIGIPVIQQSKLETSEINMPQESFIGEPIPISLEFYNMGKVTLSNLMVKVAGNFETENPNYFIGNFDAGSSEFFEAMIIPTEAGLLEGNVIFSYEDSNGETIEITKDFSLNIIAMPEENFPTDGFEGIDSEMENNSKIKKIFPWIIVISVSAVVAFIIIRKKIIQKKGISLDE